MGKYYDYAVPYNSKVDKPEDLTKRIIYNVLVKNRLKQNKPVVIFISGGSGEGKSFVALKLQEILLEMQKLNINEYFDDINVYMPIEYSQKLDALLRDKRLKKVNILTIHESRNLIRAKDWNSFLTQSVADVNAMSRSVKRICFIVISQFIRDITKDIRYTLNYYLTVTRPVYSKAQVTWWKLWFDDRDIEAPRLRKRKLKGFLVSPSGRRRRHRPQYIEFSKPSQEIIERFDKSDTVSKAKIIRNKLNELTKRIEKDMGIESPKINAMLEYYTKNIDQLVIVGKRYKKGWRLKKNFNEMHDMTKEEASEFENRLNEKLKEMGMMEEG